MILLWALRKTHTKIYNMKLFALLLLACCLSIPALAAEEHWYNYDHLYLQGGSYMHFSHSEDHDGPNIFVSLEAVRSDNWLYGLGLFDNSFGQFSQYLYAGKVWDFHNTFENFHGRITFGLIHGYKDEFKDKIPMNNLSFAPAIIPGIGYKKDRLGADLILLGNSGLLFTLGYDF